MYLWNYMNYTVFVCHNTPKLVIMPILLHKYSMWFVYSYWEVISGVSYIVYCCGFDLDPCRQDDHRQWYCGFAFSLLVTCLYNLTLNQKGMKYLEGKSGVISLCAWLIQGKVFTLLTKKSSWTCGVGGCGINVILNNFVRWKSEMSGPNYIKKKNQGQKWPKSAVLIHFFFKHCRFALNSCGYQMCLFASSKHHHLSFLSKTLHSLS